MTCWLGQWSFLLHTAQGQEYVAESCYNSAFLLHSLGHRNLARLFYLRAIQVRATCLGAVD